MCRIVLKFIILLFVWVLVIQNALFPQTFEWQGQLSGWITASDAESAKFSLGLRYIPGLSLKKPISDKYSFDFEFALNAYNSGIVHALDDIESEGKIKPYRLWLRFSSSQFEARLGLQKISFGSSTLLRPLMWFDLIDARDPLQITDGVWGLLCRYYFQNNANIWLWGLYGNDEPKGWEINPSDSRSIEYGGRFQVPLFRGEIALTYHKRRMDLSKGPFAPVLSDGSLAPENRFALDGKWDIGVGFWFEGTLVHQDSEFLPFNYRRSVNIGMDYTFGLGSGLYVLGEHFILENTQKAFGSGEAVKFSALSMNYSLGLLDNISSIFFYDWENKDLYFFLNWRRTYDKWSFYLIGFWNPQQYQIYRNRPGNNLFAGKGFQLMAVFNH